jgi:hypothetical protein
VITKTRTKYPGISKITTVTGETKYRLIIVVGKVPGTKPIRYIQECHTFGTMKEALNNRPRSETPENVEFSSSGRM